MSSTVFVDSQSGNWGADKFSPRSMTKNFIINVEITLVIMVPASSVQLVTLVQVYQSAKVYIIYTVC